jgi:hypothetical protein
MKTPDASRIICLFLLLPIWWYVEKCEREQKLCFTIYWIMIKRIVLLAVMFMTKIYDYLFGP